MGFTETAFNLLDSNRWDDRNRCPVCGNDHDGDCTEEGPDLDAPLCWYCAAPVGEEGYRSSLCEAMAQRESEGDSRAD